MTIREKLFNAVFDNAWELKTEKIVPECEKIADKFAIQFLEFVQTSKQVRYVGCVIENGEEKQYSYNRKYYNTKEMLEIFKKERGL